MTWMMRMMNSSNDKGLNQHSITMLKNILVLIVVFITAVSCTPGTQDENGQTGSTSSVNQYAFIEKPFTLDDYKGKKLLVAYWATWCPPCIEEAPILIDIHKKYSGESFSVIGVSVDKSPVLVDKFIGKFGINYPVYIEDESLKKFFGPVFGIPTLFWVDATGKIVEKNTGALPKDRIRKTAKDFAQS